jgi:hypothetical protein
MPLGQSKTKMDSEGFGIWHHGGDYRTKMSYKIPYINENTPQRRPTKRSKRAYLPFKDVFLGEIRCEGSVSEYMLYRYI